MKAIIYVFLFLGLFACGQKGPLFLVDETSNADKPQVAVDNPNAKIEPDLVRFKALTVSGKKAQVERNISADWEKILVPLSDSNNLIRYMLFNQPLSKARAPFSAVLGHVQKKSIRGQVSRQIVAGDYLRFSGVERGADQIPTLLNRINEYFATHKNLKHGKNKDFLVENRGRIEIYITVEKVAQ
ncbi:MAG: hypothetical protein CR975_01625 [Gammaproteobacteria bacterium]|nr:MAG: hypothetical protein CR975_01625 [Gammaproteobacteria bacterium]